MAYRGYLRYGNAEVANTSRVVAHLSQPTPDGDPHLMTWPATPPGVSLEYDDSWDGLREWLGHGDYTVTGAPWFDPGRAESAEFLGIWPMLIEGLDGLPVQREISESVCDGGSAERHRDTTRRINVSVLLLATSNAGAQYGMNWLSYQLRAGRVAGGLTLEYLSAHPGGSGADPNRLLRQMIDVVMTGSPTIAEYGRGYSSDRNRQGTLYRIDFELTAAIPYAYGPATTHLVEWAEDDPNGIVWVEDCPPEGGLCSTSTSVLTDPLYPPVILSRPAVPILAGSPAAATCVPLCEGRRRVWQLPTLGPSIGDRVVDVTIENTDTYREVRNLALAWVPCGESRECDRMAEASISYIPPRGRVTLDGIRGRARAVVAGQEQSAAAVVARTGGGPWRPTLLDPSRCYELVLDTDLDTEVEVSVVSRVRDS